MLDYVTHQDRVSIDELSPQNVTENVRPYHVNLDEESIYSHSRRAEMFDDRNNTYSGSPPAKQHTLHNSLHNNSTRNKHTSKGRPIHAPKCFRDYEML